MVPFDVATSRFNVIGTTSILVPRGRAPFSQYQESRPLTESDFLGMRSEFVSHSANQICQTWLWACAEWGEVYESLLVSHLTTGRDSRPVLTKTSEACGEQNATR